MASGEGNSPTNATFSLRRPTRICGAARNSACV
jgi:hypothetical protein